MSRVKLVSTLPWRVPSSARLNSAENRQCVKKTKAESQLRLPHVEKLSSLSKLSSIINILLLSLSKRILHSYTYPTPYPTLVMASDNQRVMLKSVGSVGFSDKKTFFISPLPFCCRGCILRCWRGGGRGGDRRGWTRRQMMWHRDRHHHGRCRRCRDG